MTRYGQTIALGCIWQVCIWQSTSDGAQLVTALAVFHKTTHIGISMTWNVNVCAGKLLGS
jgi:hypothetical protein